MKGVEFDPGVWGCILSEPSYFAFERIRCKQFVENVVYFQIIKFLDSVLRLQPGEQDDVDTGNQFSDMLDQCDFDFGDFSPW